MRRRPWLGRSVGAGLITVVVLLAASCGSDGHDTIRIGTVGDCYGAFSAGRIEALAGMELPFIERGARPRGTSPSDGVGSVTIAGKRVELVDGCNFLGSDVTLIDSIRRLVEQDGARIFVTNPVSYTDEFTGRLYEPYQKGVTFIAAGLAPDLRTQPNVFGIASDARQGLAGLGAYAYRQLGWRTAVTIGEGDPIGWSFAAGFIAEFCALGGKVTKRLWEPITVTDWSRDVRSIPAGTDGVAFTAGSLPAANIFGQLQRRYRDLSQHVVMSGAPIALSNAHPLGVTAAGFLPFVWGAPSWTGYIDAIHRAFPDYRGFVGGPADVNGYDGVEVALEALERAHGDVSHGQQRFRAALTAVRIQSPVGPLRIDADHHAVAPGFLIRIERDTKGHLFPATVKVIRSVEPTFGGYFRASSPPDSGTQPVCKKGRVPAWAR